jgi:hypothetical protein
MSGFFTRGTKMKTVTGYEPRFDFDVRRGKVGEDYVGTILESIASDSIEVKTDYGVNRTGNLYIEYEQETQAGNWVPSGLASSEAEYWAFALEDGVIFIRLERLKEICRDVYNEDRQGNVGYRQGNEHSNSTRGIKLSIARMVEEMKSFA